MLGAVFLQGMSDGPSRVRRLSRWSNPRHGCQLIYASVAGSVITSRRAESLENESPHVVDGIMTGNAGWAAGAHDSMIAVGIQGLLAFGFRTRLARDKNFQAQPPAKENEKLLFCQLETQARDGGKGEPVSCVAPGHRPKAQLIAGGGGIRKEPVLGSCQNQSREGLPVGAEQPFLCSTQEKLGGD